MLCPKGRNIAFRQEKAIAKAMAFSFTKKFVNKINLTKHAHSDIIYFE